jgi:FkbM family methyltransferase
MNIITKIKLIRKTFITKYQRSYYSQFGEDAVLRELIGKNKNGCYIDVGCYHPKKFSNTYMLYKNGWSGINIDLEAEKIYCFDLARPKDINIVSAISDKNELVTIYKNREFSLETTINKEIGESLDAFYQSTITTQTLNQIIRNTPYKNKQFDLLSIDCEGNDFSVLKSIDLNTYIPKIIIIETHLRKIESICNSDIYNYLTSNGYALKSWIHLSLIFILTGSEFDR